MWGKQQGEDMKVSGVWGCGAQEGVSPEEPAAGFPLSPSSKGASPTSPSG